MVCLAKYAPHLQRRLTVVGIGRGLATVRKKIAEELENRYQGLGLLKIKRREGSLDDWLEEVRHNDLDGVEHDSVGDKPEKVLNH